MERYKREQARQMRQNGMSVKEIARILEVSRSSASIWVRDIELTENQINDLKQRQRLYAGQNKGAQKNREKHRIIRLSHQMEGRQWARENSTRLHLEGCMLYWAEGGKTRKEVHFVNSDPDMLLLFAKFLRNELFVRDEEFSIQIHCHTTDEQEIKSIERYWLDLLQLSETALIKTQIKQGSNTRRNILHHGICAIRIYRGNLLQHIYGAIQEYTGIDRPEWLF